MKAQNTERFPTVLAQSPWLALCIVVLFAAGVLVYEVRNLKSEDAFTTQLTKEKGNALISILENALSARSGMHMQGNTLDTLVKNLSSDKELHFLALVDAQGRVLLGAGDIPESVNLWDSPPDALLHGADVAIQGKTHFRVSRQMQFDSGRAHGRGKHMGMHEKPQSLLLDAPVWGVADYDMKAITDARNADRRHYALIMSVLFVLAFLGAMTWYLVRRHLRSQQIAQEATAFSSYIVRSLPVGILTTDGRGCISTINAEAQRIICPSSGQAPAALPCIWMPLMGKLRAGESVRDVEMRCVFEDEKPLPLSLSASPLVTQNGLHLGYVFILRNLGEIRQLQAELRRRDRLAALGTLAAGIAHEVRNPLSAIRGIARYFEECHPADSEEGVLSKTLEQEVLRLDKVVGNLLDLSRPDNLQCAPVALDILLERARLMVEPALTKHSVVFTMNMPAPVPVITVDCDRLTQVFINLFLNSVDAMEHSPQRQITVSAMTETAAGSAWLVLEVEDTGCGIAPDKIQDIFGPYYTTKKRGTGLGLAIVHKIVEAHDGFIEARNSERGGCVVSIRLPITPQYKA